MQPNVLLLVMDAARRDAFEPYGAGPGSSPVVAQLARRGAARPEVYATAPWTVPSHASFFTGLMPRAAGLSKVPSPGAAKAALAPLRERFVTEVFARAGYRTFGVSANVWASGLSGFDTGFEDFRLVETERRAHLHDPGTRGRLRWLLQSARGREDDGARQAFDLLAERFAEGDRRPFFCFVNLLECHFPYLPPRPYGDVSWFERLRAADDARTYFRLQALYRVNGGALSMPERTLSLARRLYAGAIRSMDDWLGRVLERLDESGALDDTLVVVLSDHGENFGENGLVAHMLSLDQRLINVPFVVAGPGAETVDPTSLAALPASLAAVAGIADHPWDDAPPEGIGLAQSEPLGDPDDPKVQQALDAAGIVDEVGRMRFTKPLACAVRGGCKVVRRGDRDEWYDLETDPLEERPRPVSEVPRDHEAAVAELRDALDHPVMARAEPAAAVPSQASDEEMADLERRMKLLGYM